MGNSNFNTHCFKNNEYYKLVLVDSSIANITSNLFFSYIFSNNIRMDYIEKLIRKSWAKIPDKFKDRVKEVIVKVDVNEVEDKDPSHVYFSTKYINKRFQRDIDIMIVESLSSTYGFTEEEAWEIMKALGEPNK